MENSTGIQQKTTVGVEGKSSISTEVSKAGIGTVAILGLVVGLWSFACIIGGLVASGGPLQLVGNWFKAVTGM